MIPDGVGDLYIAFEQLKKKLQEKGLFDPAYKKPLPKYPKCICIITSEAGAAVHDMLRILRKRYPLTRVRLLPVRVQGVEAPGEIASAIHYANYYKLGDLLIVGRGGGSIEDLWAFNDEQVAMAIFQSQIPVISAVGHEPDVTISDFVADLRAATPSNGAELAVPDREALLQNLDAMQSAMETCITKSIVSARRHLNTLAGSNALKGPEAALTIRRKNVDHLHHRLIAAQERTNSRTKARFLSAIAKLDALSPLKVLSRGYSITQNEEGTVIRSVGQIASGDKIRIRLEDGGIQARVEEKENENG
jgi:exodeoxyribonuclease VII large subunit